MFSRTDDKGQATIEAAFALPVLMVLVLLLIQPGILLYDRLVMENAARETCRILVTHPGASQDARVEEFARRRLGSIPQQDLFHVHGGGCSYRIECNGNESSEQVSVRITNEMKPIPLLDVAAAFFGMTNGDGNLVLSVTAELPTQPSWVRQSVSGSPSSWIGAWNDDE